MFIERPPKWFRNLFPEAIFRMEEGEGRKMVYLTFDDGPIPEATPQVLDELDKYEVKATFFMVGDNVRKYPGLYEKVKARGHKIGNHTMHHIRGLGIAPVDYMKDVEECDEISKDGLFRPPHGWLTPGQMREVRRKYKVVMYDLITRDYSRRISAREVVDNVKKYTRPGSIIVFHDSLKSIEKLKTALPESIEWLKAEGYEFGVL